MRARPRAVSCILVALSATLVSASGASAADTWSGTWKHGEGAPGNLILTQNGSNVTGHYTWNDGSGHVSGTVSGSTFSGGFNETHYQGSFSLTLKGRSFSGSTTGHNKDTGGEIGGPFTGTCIAGPCLGNGASSAPAVTPTSEAPKLDKTTDYAAPAPGAVDALPTPTIDFSDSSVTTYVNFVDDHGKKVDGPNLVALEAFAKQAYDLCYIMILGDTIGDDFPFAASFARCAEVVTAVLARNDQIQKQKQGGGRAAAAGCGVIFAPHRKSNKSALRVSCVPAGSGFKVKIRARHGKLRTAFHGHKPKLLVGRSSIPSGPAHVRVQVRWHAS